MKKKLLILLLIFSFSTILVYGASKPNKMIIAHEDKDAYPWVVPIKEKYIGIDIEFIELLSKKMGIEVEFVAYPWARCLNELKNGSIDGIFAASYNMERESYGKFPLKNGLIDNERIIHKSGYSLYTKINSKLSFDGKQFENLNGKIGVQRTFSIIPELKKYGVDIDDANTEPTALFLKLNIGRVEAIALQTERANKVLSDNFDLRNTIKKIDTDFPPFALKNYYIMLSNKFYAKYPEFSEKFWDKQEEIFNSEEYKAIVKKFYENN